MEKTQNEKNQLVRCTDCRNEFTGCSIKDILEKSKCGRDGGPLKETCKPALKSNGKYLFEVVPIKSDSKSKKVDKVIDE